jgi:hypothetical protein
LAGEVGTFGPCNGFQYGKSFAARPSIGIQRGRRGPMLACPRCGNDAEYLGDEVFSLLRCEFCGEDIDAADLVLHDAVDRITRGLLPASREELLPPLEAEFV